MPRDLTGWLTKEQVAQRLGLTPRGVIDLRQRKQLHPYKLQRANGGAVNMYDPAEVEYLLQKRVDAKTQLVPANGPGPLMRNPPALILDRQPAPAPAPRPRTASQLKDKLYLSIEEAVAYTGLGEFHITSRVTSHPIGPRGKRVYKRTDLDKL